MYGITFREFSEIGWDRLRYQAHKIENLIENMTEKHARFVKETEGLKREYQLHLTSLKDAQLILDDDEDDLDGDVTTSITINLL